eukprot:1157683-Pelagomonas_calceolata.AAC.1
MYEDATALRNGQRPAQQTNSGIIRHTLVGRQSYESTLSAGKQTKKTVLHASSVTHANIMPPSVKKSDCCEGGQIQACWTRPVP